MPALGLAHIHALHFGEIIKQGHSTAANGRGVQPRQEEANVRLEERLQRQPVPLLRQVFGREHLIEFADQ